MGTIKEDAEKWRLLQAQRFIDAFKADTGRQPATVQELEKWITGNPDKVKSIKKTESSDTN